MTGYLYRGKPDLEELNARILAERETDGKQHLLGQIGGSTRKVYQPRRITAALARKAELPSKSDRPDQVKR